MTEVGADGWCEIGEEGIWRSGVEETKSVIDVVKSLSSNVNISQDSRIQYCYG